MATDCPRCPILIHEVEALRAALDAGDVINQAKGLVMAARGCDADDAFRILVEQSRQEDRELHDVATELIRRPRLASSAPAVARPTYRPPARRALAATLWASISVQRDAATLRLHGEGDLFCCEALEGALEELAASYLTVIVDLSGVRFADSRFVTTFDQAARRHPDTRLVIRAAPEVFHLVARVCGIGEHYVVEGGTPLLLDERRRLTDR
jgi:anti-anti-sigma regulatory factor